MEVSKIAIINPLSLGGEFTGVSSLFNSILSIFISIFVLALFIVPMIIGLIFLYRYMLFKYRIHVFGLVGRAGLRYDVDWGRLKNNKDGTSEFVLRSRNRKKWLVPVPKRDVMVQPEHKGAVNLFLAKVGAGDSDVQWIDPNGMFTNTEIKLIDPLDRKEWVMAHVGTEQKYIIQSAFQKYQHIIVPLAFGVLFTVAMIGAMIFISDMWGATVNQASVLGDKIVEASKSFAEQIQRAKG